MRHKLVTALACLCFGALAPRAEAVPINYVNTLVLGQTFNGTSTQDNASPFPDIFGDVPVGADYWSLDLTAGNRINVAAKRAATSPHFDPDLWVFFNPLGLYTNTDQFGGFLTSSTPGFVANFVDNIPSLIGPFGDPAGTFVAPFTGIYTIIVTSGLSNVGSPDQYTLLADPVPEPASMLLIGTGLVFIASAVRRRRMSSKGTA